MVQEVATLPQLPEGVHLEEEQALPLQPQVHVQPAPWQWLVLEQLTQLFPLQPQLQVQAEALFPPQLVVGEVQVTQLSPLQPQT